MKFIVYFILIILLSSCGESVYDNIGNLICKDLEECGSTKPDKLDAPSKSDVFASILSNSKLHYPDTQTKVDYGKFQGFVSDYFYLDDIYLTFQLNKERDGKYRSELRQGPNEWDVSDNKAHILRAKVRCYGSKQLSKYTFIQIHGNENFSLPLLRVVWERRHNGKTNHLWAVVMTSRDFTNKSYEWIDLGERKSSFFDIEVAVRDNNLYLGLDSKTYIDKDISYWHDIDNYYKVGLYLNDKKSRGETKVQFESLEYIVR